MASQSTGIQQLLAAEKKSAEKVAEARKRTLTLELTELVWPKSRPSPIKPGHNSLISCPVRPAMRRLRPKIRPRNPRIGGAFDVTADGFDHGTAVMYL